MPAIHLTSLQKNISISKGEGNVIILFKSKITSFDGHCCRASLSG
jgi:hypothetical protein